MKSSGCASLQGGGGHGMGPELFASKWEAFGDGTVTALLGGELCVLFSVFAFFSFLIFLQEQNIPSVN